MTRQFRLIALVLVAALLLTYAAGCRDDASKDHPNADARGAAARKMPYQASVLREPFHKAECRWAKKISTANLVGYRSREDVIKDGHRPCKVCRP